MLERSLRRSLLMSDGSPAIFFTRPLSAAFLVCALLFLLSPLFRKERIGKEAIETED